jgi:hypothetical protein
MKKAHKKLNFIPIAQPRKKERPPKQKGFNQISQHSTLLEVSHQYGVSLHIIYEILMKKFKMPKFFPHCCAEKKGETS